MCGAMMLHEYYAMHNVLENSVLYTDRMYIYQTR